MFYKHKKTKIIATVGPACANNEAIRNMINHGVNVFRFNMKHGTMEGHHKNIDIVQEEANKLHVPIGILVDLQGPEIRIQTQNKEDLVVTKNQKIKFVQKFDLTSKEPQIKIVHKSVFTALEEGDMFSIDNGYIQLVVQQSNNDNFIAIVQDDAVIKNMKSMNLFGKDLKLPSLIKDDIERLTIADSRKIDYVALSFVRSKRDLDILRKHMKEKGIDAQVVAKIESQAAIDNIDEIIKESDVVMIARGDLGVETPIEKLAYYQKMIITKCRHANTPVIVATQMLESMINSPIPTRAEATDVANAVLDGTDALMLSGETAIGKYPERAVMEMSKIAMFNEEKSEVVQFDIKPQNATELIVEAAETIAQNSKDLKIDHIVVMTETGYTAKVLSVFRPKIPVIAITDLQKTVEILTMSYGVRPVKVKLPQGTMLTPNYIIKQLKDLEEVEKGELVLLIHGQHWKKPGQTNAVVLITVE